MAEYSPGLYRESACINFGSYWSGYIMGGGFCGCWGGFTCHFKRDQDTEDFLKLVKGLILYHQLSKLIGRSTTPLKDVIPKMLNKS